MSSTVRLTRPTVGRTTGEGSLEMAEDTYSTILKALMPESGGDSTAALQALLPQAGGSNSQVQLLTTLLAAQQAARAEWEAQEAAEDPYVWETHNPGPVRNFSSGVSPLHNERRGYHRAQEKYRRLRGELEGLREWNETLAAALGACPRCWGENIRCAGCQGRGSPGTEAPDRQLFATFVLPAVQRVRAEQSNGQLRRKERLRQQFTTEGPITHPTGREQTRPGEGNSSIEDKEDEGD